MAENRPTPEAVALLKRELLFERAAQTYLWVMPLLNALGMKAGSEKVFGPSYNVLPIWKERLDAKTLVTTPNSDVLYAMSYIDVDSSGTPLDGLSSFTITFPSGQEPPVSGFWSMTIYNDHHFFNPNELGRYSPGTKNKGLKRNADGSLTLYAGAASPGSDKESNWLPAPQGPFSLYIRAYWGQKAILDGIWQPPRIEVAEYADPVVYACGRTARKTVRADNSV